MIKNVSNTYKSNCKKDSVKYREYIVIDNKEVDIKGDLSDTAYKDTTFFGKFNLKMLKFETENDIDYKKKEFVYYKEVDGEALKIGTFIVTDVSDSDTFESVNVTAYDYGLKFANPYKTNLDYENGNITMFQVAKEICTNCGMELENTSLPNGSFLVDSNQFVNNEQYGDVICIIALENGTFATTNSNDKLEFIFTNETNEIIEDYVELDDKRDTWPITSVLVATSKELESAGAVRKDEALIEEYGEHWLKIYDYAFAYSTEKCQQLVEAIFKQVKGFAYSSFKSEYSFLPYLSLGDKIKFKNKNGELVDSLILRYETNYDEITFEAPSIISASVEYTLPETDEQKIDRVGIEVNQALKIIKLLSEKIVDISAQASGRKEVELDNCSATTLYKLKITGDDSLLFPGDKKKYFTYENYEGSTIDTDIKGSSYDINNLEVKGRSTQEVRSGYNVYQATKSSYTEAGLTITNNGDGTYIVNGTATSDLSTALNDDFMPVSGTFRIVGCPSGGSSSTYMLSAYVGYWGGASPNIDIGNGTNITYTGNFKLRLYIKEGTVCNNLLFKPMVTYDLTKNYNDFEPYGVSPSPDYPSEIETIKGTLKIVDTGKNLANINDSQIGVAWNLSTNSARAICNIRVMPNTTCSLSFENINGIDAMFFGEKVKNTDTGVIGGMTQITANRQITTTSTTNWLCVQFNKANISMSDIEAIKLQIEEGEMVTSYEPYKSQTLNVDLQGNELFSIGDTKDVLGISVTGDTKINKKIGKVVLDGSGTSYVVADSSWGNNVFAYTGNNNRKPWSKGLSDYFTFVQGTGSAFVLNDGEFCIGQGAIIFRNDAINTLEEFKTWLSTHNVTVIYELATPETINLSPTKSLYLYDGINHLTNDNIAYMVAKMVKSTMFLKTSDLYVNQGQSNEKIFNLKIPALRELNGVKDEYNLENTKATLTKRIGLNANLEEYILDEPQIIDLGEMTIELNEGTNILTMPSFPNNYYEVTYLLKNEYTDIFTNQAQVSSMINIASDEILIKSKTEILANGDELIASINTKATGDVLIDASRLAQINANKINFNSYDFNVTTQNMKISIGQGDDKKDIINANGVLTNLQFKSSNQIWGNGQSASYPLGFSPEAEIQGGSEIYPSRKSYLQIDYDVPENFVISNAYITIFHTPIYWDNGQYHTWGYCRNLGIFKVTNSGNFVINLAFFGEGETLGEFNTEIINNAFGNNTYWTAKIPNNDSYLSENITTNDLTNNIDKTGHGTLLIQSNDTAPTSNTLAGLYTSDGAGGKTGSAYAILNIIGYSQV